MYYIRTKFPRYQRRNPTRKQSVTKRESAVSPSPMAFNFRLAIRLGPAPGLVPAPGRPSALSTLLVGDQRTPWFRRKTFSQRRHCSWETGVEWGRSGREYPWAPMRETRGDVVSNDAPDGNKILRCVRGIE